MVGTGFCQTRQSILYFGTDDEMSDDEIRTEAHPCIPATNVEPGTVGQRRVEQTGDIKSPVQRQSRTRRNIIRKSKCSTDFKRNDFLKKNEAYPLGALRSLKFAYRKLRISLFVELAV